MFIPLNMCIARASRVWTNNWQRLARAMATCKSISSLTPNSEAAFASLSFSKAPSIAARCSSVLRWAAGYAASPSKAMRNSKQRIKSAIPPIEARRRNSPPGCRWTNVPAPGYEHPVRMQPGRSLTDHRAGHGMVLGELILGRKPVADRALDARKNWRRGSESNRRIKVLQTSPLPLGYRAQ